MEKLRHTFLFEEALWVVKGRYFDVSGIPMPCVGQSRISHESGLWINEGTLKILGEKPAEFRNRYEIVPFADGSETTTWQSFNPDLEPLIGQFIIVFDSIFSPWESENGTYRGSEFMVQVEENLYYNRGFAFRSEERLSAWAVELTRKE